MLDITSAVLDVQGNVTGSDDWMKNAREELPNGHERNESTSVRPAGKPIDDRNEFENADIRE